MENKKIYINNIELPERPTECKIDRRFKFGYPTHSCDCRIKINDQEYNFIADDFNLTDDSIYLYTMIDILP